MPKRKPSRSQRRRGSRPLVPPPAARPAPVQPVASPAAATAPVRVDAPRERSISRFTARDYTYVRRELLRIVILAIGIMTVLVVLSFFLP